MSNNEVVQLAFALFGTEAPVQEPEPQSQPGRWESWYTDKWIEALVDVFTAPVRIGREYPQTGIRHREDVIIERMVNLMRLHRHQQDELDGEPTEDDYHRWGKEWRGAGSRITNWETCILLCDASAMAPLTHEAVEEYKRAFAHCFSIDQFAQCWGSEVIRIADCELFRYHAGYGKLPPLDEDERRWVEDFNSQVLELEATMERGEVLAENLFEPVESY